MEANINERKTKVEKKTNGVLQQDNKKLATTLVLQIFLAGGANVALAFKN